VPAANTQSRPRATTALAIASLAAGALLWTAVPVHADPRFFPKSIAVWTNNHYNHDCFWGGPRGMDYAVLPNPQPIQIPNLYPDVGSTYLVAQFKLPDGAYLTIHGDVPYERYFSFTIANNLAGGGLGGGDFLRDEFIEPDAGSVNPSQRDQPRDAKNRAYTIRILPGPVPAVKEPNTVYTPTSDRTELVHLSMRNYIPDRRRDGTGGVGLPQVTLTLADGSTQTGETMCQTLQAIKAQTANATFPKAVWESLVAADPDPPNAPSKNPPRWERFWNALYSIAGLFIADQDLRAATYPPTEAGGLAANPDTRYLFTGTSSNFGDVLLVTGKMPTTPRTFRRNKTWPASFQVRYWSMCTASSPVVGKGYDCVWDEKVPVDANGYYHIVLSKRDKKPRNARRGCGYYWLNIGDGDGYASPVARSAVNAAYMRFMAADPDWENAPQKVTTPGTEQAVMGEYFPQSQYMSKAEFEALGCPRR
jgi:hypothetical protein